MKISLKWIQKYVDISDLISKPEDLAAKLTHAGLEVESIEKQASPFDHVVVGEILEKKQHPDADKLSVCQVATGSGIVHQIVCGAKNHKESDKVVVALPGAKLPNGVEISRAALRGVESNGMLCSQKELALSNESSGLMILPSDASIGQNFATYYQLDDVFFTIKVTPNRADCLSHIGLSREIATLYNREIKLPKVATENFKAKMDSNFAVKVSNEDLCPRYAGRRIQGVKVGPSPAWLSKALQDVGFNSINNVVDVTNFVMLEYGQPLHAFDQSLLSGKSIEIKLAQTKEKFTSLDGKEFSLNGSELMIYDSKHPVAMAGVVGGKNSGVLETTRDLFIECAYFKPQAVRKASRSHGIQTDSAYRFSRGIDIHQTIEVLNRACDLILQVAGGEVESTYTDIYPRPLPTTFVKIKLSFLTEKLGFAIQAEDWEVVLKKLKVKFEVEGETYTIESPSYRHDLSIAEDYVEEFARLFGYDKIPETKPLLNHVPQANHYQYDLYSKARLFLSSRGHSEALNYAFTSAAKETLFLGDRAKLNQCGLSCSKESVSILNPLSEDYSVMRSSITYALLQNAFYNIRRSMSFGRYFELGSSFQGDYSEESRLALVFWGKKENIWGTTKEDLVFSLKAEVIRLFEHLGIKDLSFKMEVALPQFLHPGKSAIVYYHDKAIGFLGELHPSKAEEEKLRVPLAIAEFQLDFLRHLKAKDLKVIDLSQFLSVERDLAFVFDKNTNADSIVAEIYKVSPWIKSVEVFDEYRGEKLDRSKKSLAFRMRIEDSSKTLLDEELLQLQNQIIEMVKKLFDANLR